MYASEASYLYLHFSQDQALHIMVFISTQKFKNVTLMLNNRLLQHTVRQKLIHAELERRDAQVGLLQILLVAVDQQCNVETVKAKIILFLPNS
jgi:hypothetical protein